MESEPVIVTVQTMIPPTEEKKKIKTPRKAPC